MTQFELESTVEDAARFVGAGVDHLPGRRRIERVDLVGPNLGAVGDDEVQIEIGLGVPAQRHEQRRGHRRVGRVQRQRGRRAELTGGVDGAPDDRVGPVGKQRRERELGAEVELAGQAAVFGAGRDDPVAGIADQVDGDAGRVARGDAADGRVELARPNDARGVGELPELGARHRRRRGAAMELRARHAQERVEAGIGRGARAAGGQRQRSDGNGQAH